MRTPRLSILAGLLLFMPAAAGAWPWSKQLTKEQVVKEGLERYQEVHDDFAKKYPKNPEWLVQLKTAQTYFKEQSDAYLKQDLPYRQEELWRLKRVINEQIRGEQNAIEIYRQGQRRGEKAEETQQKVEAARQVAALKIQTAAMPEMPKDASAEKPGAEMGHGVASTAGDLLASGSRNPDGHVSPVDRVWRGRVEASSLVVNLGLASVECAQNAEKCVPPKPLPPIPPNPPVDPAPVSSLPVNPTNPVATPGTPQPVQPLPNAPGGQEPAIPIVLPPNWHQNAADTATGPGATNGMITGGALAAKRGDYSLAMSLAKAALSSNPGNQDALALMHSVKGRADAIDAGAAGGASAAATAAALAAGARDPGATGGTGAAGTASASAAAPLFASEGARAAAAQQAIASAQNSLKLGDPQGAVEYLDKALADDPNNALTLNARAALLARVGRWEDAYQATMSALAVSPENRSLLRIRGQAENRTRRYKEALATSESLAAADPKDPWAFAIRGHALGGQGNREAMLTELRAAAAIDPKFQAALEQAMEPADGDLMFLYPGETAPKGAPAAGAAAAAPSRGRSFSVVVAAGIAGGLLLALGLLSVVMAPVKEAVVSAFTKTSRTGPSIGAVPTAQPASVAGEVGGLIRGQYEIVRQIGAGGMGMVYEGKDRSLGRRVAVKKMREELRANPRERDRFIIEAKTVAALRHPNIVDIYAIAEQGDDVYLVFEYVDGRTVHDLVQAAGRLEPAQAVSVTRSMGEALTYAHSRGVIHRDMKPSNVMLTGSNEVKVMDFGIARMAKDAMTRYSMTNTVVGTPPYMAPEQEQGVVRKESDVYALAICAYEMLTGKLPFIGLGAGMLMNKINMSYIAPSRAIAGLPEPLDEVFAKAFQADPDNRHRTPQEFVSALAAAAGGARSRA